MPAMDTQLQLAVTKEAMNAWLLFISTCNESKAAKINFNKIMPAINKNAKSKTAVNIKFQLMLSKHNEQ